MIISLESALKDAGLFVSSEFNIQLEKSQLKPYSPDNWNKFCKVNGFEVNSDGLYVPASYSAYVRIDSPVLVSNIFHELYGHGLFCEQSQIGKKLIDIVQNKGNEKAFLFDEVNPQMQLFGLCKTNIDNYEGFAVWLEALLCRETDNAKVWQLKKDRLPNNYISLFEFFQDIEQRLTRFGFMSQLGFPKFYDDEKVLDIAKRLYGSAFNNINFMVLYGSQKPESDIDLFVVSANSSTNYFNGWLDIYELNKVEFTQLLNNMDISVTDPLFSGKLIYGDENIFEQLKQKIQSQPITQEAIVHNISEAEKQKQYLLPFAHNLRERKICLSYINSYSRNAEHLQNGNKLLTLQNLICC